MLRRTVSHGNKLGSWKTKPRSAFAPVMTSSPTRSSPELGKSSPAMRRRRVDFPQALGPTMETNSPAATEKETASRANMRVVARSLGGENFGHVFHPQRGAFRCNPMDGAGYHLMTPFCQTSTRSRTLKRAVMMVEKKAAMMTSAA